MFENIDSYLIAQIQRLLGYEDSLFDKAIRKTIPRSIERYRYCLSHKNVKYHPQKICYHADEYTSFLYFVSNELWRQTCESAYAEKIYLLNRYLNSVDIFYDREMPDIFHLVHPIGSIIGRASIGNYFVMYQGATVGGNLDLELPVIGENVAIFAGAKVIGRCVIGNNCQIGAGVVLHNEPIQDGSTIISAAGKQVIKSKRDFKSHFFK